MKKKLIKIFAAIFAAGLVFCVLFGQTIRDRDTVKVSFGFAQSGSVSREMTLSGAFVWANTEDILFDDAYSYPLRVTGIMVSPGDRLDSSVAVLSGDLLRPLAEKREELESLLRYYAHRLALLRLEERTQASGRDALALQRAYYAAEYARVKEEMGAMDEIQLQLESMHCPAPAYFVQSYLGVGEIYDGTGAAFQISYDERPQIRFELPAGVALSPGDAMQFSMDSDAAYFCTVASIERQSDAAVALAMPDPAMWNEYRPADALAATPRVHYVYQSERYDTIVPNAAIYTLDGQAYVRLAVREPSYWSYDYVVRTMPVTVIERGDSHTAIAEKLFTSDPVILAPDTMLMDGQRILEK